MRDVLAFTKLIGTSPRFLEAVRHLPFIAKSSAPVLLTGETGTGKELVARALHDFGARAQFPFVAVNGGTLPEALVESELFGHEKGAFTDARLRHEGLVAQADGGTLFLDEIDSLSRKAQVALLRFLQEKRYRPVGAAAERAADVRVVAATNAPLEELVEAGAFRADLYFRLGVFAVRLPPLRERPEDLGLLATHFLAKHAAHDRRPPRLSCGALAALRAHAWPGNVRELENAVVRGCSFCEGEVVEADDLGLTHHPPPGCGRQGPHSFRDLKRQAVEDFERHYLTHLLETHEGNVSHAARASGQERRQLGKLLKKHHLDPSTFRPRGALIAFPPVATSPAAANGVPSPYPSAEQA